MKTNNCILKLTVLFVISKHRTSLHTFSLSLNFTEPNSPFSLKSQSPSNSSSTMPTTTSEHGKSRKPRFKFISPSDPIPNTRFFSHKTSTPKLTRSQFNHPTYEEANQPFVKMPKKKMFTFLTLKVLGCGGNSSSVSVPATIISAAKWESKKVRIKKKKKKRQSNNSRSSSNPKTHDNVVDNVPDVCCTPPGIGFAYDVAPRARADAARKTHRERSQAARRTANLEHVSPSGAQSEHNTAWLRTNVSDARQYSRPPRTFPRGLSEIILFQHNLLLEGSFDGSDQFVDWRLNVDFMSYEELLELSDKIGHVGAGLQEDEILSCLKKPRQSFLRSLSFVKSRGKDWKCSICQEECKGDDVLGRLDCGHYHHIDCIKQWLLQKNVCPVCKAAAKAGK